MERIVSEKLRARCYVEENIVLVPISPIITLSNLQLMSPGHKHQSCVCINHKCTAAATPRWVNYMSPVLQICCYFSVKLCIQRLDWAIDLGRFGHLVIALTFKFISK